MISASGSACRRKWLFEPLQRLWNPTSEIGAPNLRFVHMVPWSMTSVSAHSLPPDRVSLLTLDGRVTVPFRFGAYAAGRLERIRGQADLLYRKSSSTFFLAVTVDAPEPEPNGADEFV